MITDPYFFHLDKSKVHNLSLEFLIEEIKKQKIRADLKTIRRAYAFAQKAHQGQKRLSGEDFIYHPLFVAYIIVKMGLGEDSITAALLHDAVEDSSVSIRQIEDKFNLEVALVVDGLTQVRKTVKKFGIHQEPIAGFRKMLLASIEDIRVLIIRLADKLHNGLTIESLPLAKQKRYARAIFYLYAPLAEYAGLGYFKRELEDIAFAIEYPREYRQVVRGLKQSQGEREKEILQLSKEISSLLKDKKISFIRIYGRRKGFYSIWKKMEKYVLEGKTKKPNINHILDKIGITIIVPSIPSCYVALGAIHQRWPFLEEKLDDYVSRPKLNGYQAIQTTVKTGKDIVEIQIKTRQMHQYNEFGPASHIAYKAAGGKPVTDVSYSWIEKLARWKRKGERNYRIKVFNQFVYVVTPKGDVVQLEKGGTPLDFAYKIHTHLGESCQGAKVNDKMVRLNHRLENGDLVEIIRRKISTGPKRDWLGWVKMKETKKAIKKGLKKSA